MTSVRPSAFSLAVSLVSLLLTLVIALSIWESYYPPHSRRALRERREYYERVLLKADISWKEGLYYRVYSPSGSEK